MFASFLDHGRSLLARMVTVTGMVTVAEGRYPVRRWVEGGWYFAAMVSQRVGTYRGCRLQLNISPTLRRGTGRLNERRFCLSIWYA